jgi:hypothetical protein
MAHFAQLDENNVVINVIVVSNAETSDANGVENETIGVAFCKKLFGADTQWAQTSYNGNIRKNYAGVGYTYDVQRDAFIPHKPFNSWVLNEDTCTWEAPVAMPEDAGTGDPIKVYRWDEDTINWVLVV